MGDPLPVLVRWQAMGRGDDAQLNLTIPQPRHHVTSSPGACEGLYSPTSVPVPRTQKKQQIKHAVTSSETMEERKMLYILVLAMTPFCLLFEQAAHILLVQWAL